MTTEQNSKPSNEWKPEELAAYRAAVARYVECSHDFGQPNQFGVAEFDRCQKCGSRGDI